VRIARLTIKGFRGIKSADIKLGAHTVLVGPNNSGKTSVIEALALLLGRDRLVRRLTEHDFYGSAPSEESRIIIVATVTDFPQNDPLHSPGWFGAERGVEKWLDPKHKRLRPTADHEHTDLAVQIGFAARFDLDELEAEAIRFFVDDEESLGDPFAEQAHLRTLQGRVIQELGFYLVPVSRTWDRWISFSSELFRRVVATLGGVPAKAVRTERQRLWHPPDDERLERQPGLSDIVNAANEELSHLIPSAPKLQLRLTSTDSDSVLDTVIPHFAQGNGPTLPAMRHGTGLVSLQSLLLLMQFGRARAKASRSFVLAVEEPELHIQPSQQKRLVNRLNALCDQTIVTTHSPIVATMFPPADTIFVRTMGGELIANPLVEIISAAPTNHQQHLLYAWRQKLVAALMQECALIPEGVSDVAWLEALEAALELRQPWSESSEALRFSTFIGVVPTNEAQIVETFRIVERVHPRPCVLLDGDSEGWVYFDTLRSAGLSPKRVVFWAKDWEMEDIVVWMSEASPEGRTHLEKSLGQTFHTSAELKSFLLKRKTYAPTHETVAMTIMALEPCRTRAEQLLSGLTEVLCNRTNVENALFQKSQVDSSPCMEVFRFTP
jgi:putative ATP-dependent endonuclease of the OLD family